MLGFPACSSSIWFYKRFPGAADKRKSLSAFSYLQERAPTPYSAVKTSNARPHSQKLARHSAASRNKFLLYKFSRQENNFFGPDWMEESAFWWPKCPCNLNFWVAVRDDSRLISGSELSCRPKLIESTSHKLPTSCKQASRISRITISDISPKTQNSRRFSISHQGRFPSINLSKNSTLGFCMFFC